MSAKKSSGTLTADIMRHWQIIPSGRPGETVASFAARLRFYLKRVHLQNATASDSPREYSTHGLAGRNCHVATDDGKSRAHSQVSIDIFNVGFNKQSLRVLAQVGKFIMGLGDGKSAVDGLSRK
jgi:hypothetical protein